MNFRTFRRKYAHYPLIKSSYFAIEDRPAYVRRLVSEWCRKGWVLQLKRGMYLINEPEFLRDKERFLLANELYEPSYVSLESALSFHGMIPEAVLQTTSISTRKTTVVTNVLGTFRYAHVKSELFWGFEKKRVGAMHAVVARPEKALLDLLYLRKATFKSADDVVESLRLQGLSALSQRELMRSAARFGERRLLQLARELTRLFPEGARKK